MFRFVDRKGLTCKLQRRERHRLQPRLESLETRALLSGEVIYSTFTGEPDPGLTDGWTSFAQIVGYSAGGRQATEFQPSKNYTTSNVIVLAFGPAMENFTVRLSIANDDNGKPGSEVGTTSVIVNFPDSPHKGLAEASLVTNLQANANYWLVASAPDNAWDWCENLHLHGFNSSFYNGQWHTWVATPLVFQLTGTPGSQPDLAVAPPTWTAGQGVNVGYTISGADLPTATTAALYWSADATFDPSQDTLIAGSVTTTQTAQGTYSIHVNASTLGTPPTGAKYLLAVVDPNNTVSESDETNNVVSMPIKRPDLIATSLTWNTAQGGVDYAYTISGGDLPQGATGALYWLTDTSFNTGQHSLIPNSVFTTATSSQTAPYTGHIDATTLGTPPDASYTNLLFVLNSDDAVTESDGPFSLDPNNVQAIAIKPDLSVVDLVYNSAGVGLVYKLDGLPLPKATFVEYDWASGDSVSRKLGPAADPVVLPAGTAVGTHNDAGVLIGNLRLPPPPGTTHLLVVLDPLNLIGDPTPNNNVRAIRVHPAPTVEFSFIDPSGNVLDKAQKGQTYQVWARITNNDVVDPINVQLRWFEQYTTAPYPLDPSNGGSVGPITVANDSQVSVELGVVSHSWEWIPPQEPGHNIRETFLNVVADALGTGLTHEVAELLTTIIPNLLTVLGASHFSHPSTMVSYAAEVNWGGFSPIQLHNDLPIEVSQDLKAWLANFVALNIQANLYTSYALPLLVRFDPANAAVYLASEVRMLNAADAAYSQALDPPDPNYAVIAAPEPTATPELQAFSSVLIGTFAQTVADYEGWIVAEAKSRNRALGAKDAGDSNWESLQMNAAADYASRATLALNKLSAIQSLLDPYVASTIAPNRGSVAPVSER